MSSEEQPIVPESTIDLPTKFPNLKADFAREIAGDLQGLAEGLQDGTIDGLGFLEFILKHLHKIDEYIEFNWT